LQACRPAVERPVRGAPEKALMALSEFEVRRLEKIVGSYLESKRPPPELRKQLDLKFRIHGQSVEIDEVRPYWRDPDEITENPVAKATYVRRTDLWKLYWQRADLKWHRYDPDPEATSIEEVLKIVDRDEHCCFFG
jgi:hypothetical protein